MEEEGDVEGEEGTAEAAAAGEADAVGEAEGAGEAEEAEEEEEEEGTQEFAAQACATEQCEHRQM